MGSSTCFLWWVENSNGGRGLGCAVLYGASGIKAVQMNLKIKSLAFSLTLARAHVELVSKLGAPGSLRQSAIRTVSWVTGSCLLVGGPINCLEKTNFWIFAGGPKTSRGTYLLGHGPSVRARTDCVRVALGQGQPTSFGIESGFLRSSPGPAAYAD